MTEIRFYHMTVKRLEQALPELLAKVLERGHRAVVRLDSAVQVQAVDTLLWTYEPSSFLPHGHKDSNNDAEHPVWLTTEEDNPNNADVLVLAEGAEAKDVSRYTLVCDVFDGQDDDATQAARQRWASYREDGHAVSYFQQDAHGRWDKKQ